MTIAVLYPLTTWFVDSLVIGDTKKVNPYFDRDCSNAKYLYPVNGWDYFMCSRAYIMLTPVIIILLLASLLYADYFKGKIATMFILQMLFITIVPNLILLPAHY